MPVLPVLEGGGGIIITAIVPVALPLIFGRLLLVGFDNCTCYHLIRSGLHTVLVVERAANMVVWYW